MAKELDIKTKSLIEAENIFNGKNRFKNESEFINVAAGV